MKQKIDIIWNIVNNRLLMSIMYLVINVYALFKCRDKNERL